MDAHLQEPPAEATTLAEEHHVHRRRHIIVDANVWHTKASGHLKKRVRLSSWLDREA
jgi:hypothetical protein